MKKLDEFNIEDKYNLSREIILAEAQASAERRAEQYGWTGVTVIHCWTVHEQSITYHHFNIYGDDEEMK